MIHKNIVRKIFSVTEHRPTKKKNEQQQQQQQQ